MQSILKVKRQWERELDLEDSSEYGSEEHQDSYDAEERERDRHDAIMRGEDVEMKDEEEKPTDKPAKHLNLFGAVGSLVQPKIPLIKEAPLKFKAAKALKKFTMNAFLDRFLEEERAKEAALANKQQEEVGLV